MAVAWGQKQSGTYVSMLPDRQSTIIGNRGLATGKKKERKSGGLSSGIWREAPFARLHISPGHRTCSFISHLNPQGSVQPDCHFRRTELFKLTSLHCPTRYTHLYSWVKRVHVWAKCLNCLGSQRRSIVSAAGDRTRDLSLVRRARSTTEPRRPTNDQTSILREGACWLWNSKGVYIILTVHSSTFYLSSSIYRPALRIF